MFTDLRPSMANSMLRRIPDQPQQESSEWAGAGPARALPRSSTRSVHRAYPGAGCAQTTPESLAKAGDEEAKGQRFSALSPARLACDAIEVGCAAV
jgi:hypothetical protein